MARYDRIAPLDAPARERAFSAWSVLRDLEGRERDAELGRRTRLRFLALRPVCRLLARGIHGVPVESFERQIEGIREELGHLPARDPERERLARYLNTITERTPSALVAATLDIGAGAESARHRFGAEEYFRTALEVAMRHDLSAERVVALCRLGRLYHGVGERSYAEQHYSAAAALALELDERADWVRAMDGLAAMHREDGALDAARAVLAEVLDRARSWGDTALQASALLDLLETELDAGGPELALEHGMAALQIVTDDEKRYGVLVRMGAALLAVGMPDVAESCFELASLRARNAATVFRARAGHALAAAEAGRADAFRQRRAACLERAMDGDDDPDATADVHLSLGRGCLLIGDIDFARDHLRVALAAAGAHGLHHVSRRAETLLPAMEDAGRGAPSARPTPGERARRIAAELLSLQQAAARAD